MHPIVTYGLIALCAALFGFGFWAEGRKDGQRLAKMRRYGLAMQLGAIVAAYLVLRPGRGDDPRAAMQASTAAGQPVLLDIYSNW